MVIRLFALAALVGSALAADVATLEGEVQGSGEPIHALLITGHNNHNWKYTCHVHADTLAATGKFAVDITEDPATTLANAAELKKYQVFVLDYNDSQATKRWGEAAEKNFEAAVKDGTGVVAIHSANNAFIGWAEYEKMLGLMWIDKTTGHGQFHPFDVKWLDTEHPITKGLGEFKQHPDELYHKLVNTQKVPVHLLANAMSDKATGGTGNEEPMAMTLTYGKGRIFATPLGHVWLNSDNNKVSIADPMFKILVCRGAEWAATGAVTQGTAWKDVREHNALTAAEKTGGWELLFDGKAPVGFHAFAKKGMPEKGWSVKDGMLVVAKGEGGGDLASNEDYGDFEFSCEWRVTTGANSGIIYRATEDHKYPWETGPEMQILDDSGHADGKKPKTRAGTFYDVVACSEDVCRPAGEWNRARIVAKGTHIQHFLNDVKVVDVDMASDAYKAALKESKWPGMKDFGTKMSGRICLQEHGDEVAFRDIKVRKVK